MQYLLMIYQNKTEYGKIDAGDRQEIARRNTAPSPIHHIQAAIFKAGDRLATDNDGDHRARP